MTNTFRRNKLRAYIFILFMVIAGVLLSGLAYASTLLYSDAYDTDGDGTSEIITLNDVGSLHYISIQHPRTGQVINYDYNTGPYSIYRVIDTDGVAGAELIVVYQKGTSVGIDVIHDRTRVTTDNPFNNQQFAIFGTNNTDGQPGEEIVVLTCQGCIGHYPPDAQSDCAGTGVGAAVTINVLANDRALMSGSTLVPSTVTVTSQPLHGSAQKNSNGTITYTPAAGFADVDYFAYTVADDSGAVSNVATVSIHVGAASGSCVYPLIAAQEPTGTNNSKALLDAVTGVSASSSFTIAGIQVINDRTKTPTYFSFNNTAFTINSITDTDGLAGTDIIVPWQIGSQTGIRVLHANTAAGSERNYSPPSSYYIDSVRNYDSIAGDEICYSYVFGYNFMYGLITDKTGQTKEGPNGCASLVQHVPIAPDGLSATAMAATQINLSWNDNSSDETGFVIQRKTGTGGYTTIASVGPNTKTYQNTTGLSPNINYCYHVVAKNAVGDSNPSNEACATTLQQIPTAPTNLTARAVYTGRIDLQWADNANNEESYTIERKASGGSYAPIATVGPNQKTYSDTGLTPGVTYYYRVFAYNLAGNSDVSNEANATPVSNPVPVISVAPASWDYGTVLVGSAPVTKTFTITNSGTNDVFLYVVNYAGSYGPNTTAHTVTADMCSAVTLRPQDICTFALTFSPQATGTGQGNVNIPSAQLPTVAVPITGYGQKQFTLTVQKAGTGTGTVASLPVGIDCGNDCSETYNENTTVTLTHSTANAFSNFAGWSDSNCPGNGPCTVTMTANATVAATFNDISPSDLSTTDYSATQINLTWSDNSADETEFIIERKTDKEGVYFPIALVGANVTSYASKGLIQNTSYFYRVRAYNASGFSAYTNETNAQTVLPTTPAISQSAAGESHTVALKSDGTLWAWGDNQYGQLGDSTMLNKDVPVQIGTKSTWVSIAAGSWHNVALKSDGTLWAWGSNYFGGLGDGTTKDKYAPVQIGVESTWVSVAGGKNHTVALKSDGTLWAWGDNRYGQLGDGTKVNKSVPVQIGTESTWVLIAAGGWHTVALKSDGTLWAWGNNTFGQLGDISSLNKTAPVQIGAESTWVSVAGGGLHTVALNSDGTLWAWGDNRYGQLGDGTTVNKNAPLKIGEGSTWVSVAAGMYHTVALTLDGKLWAWGSNSSGQLGDSTTDDKSAPVQIGAGSTWVSIAVGGGHTVALRSDGTLWAWGYNLYGQLGDGTTAGKTIPTQVPGIVLDNIAPTGNIVLNGGSAYITSTTATLTLSCADSGSGCALMEFSDDSGQTWSAAEVYQQSVTRLLPVGDGEKIVSVRYTDLAGNPSAPIPSNMVVLDTMPPVGTISINNNAAYTNSTAVTLTLTASDLNGIAAMKFSNDGGGTWTAAEPFAQQKAWTLSSGDNEKIVYVKYQDQAGWWSNGIGSSIVLDATAPVFGILWRNKETGVVRSQTTDGHTITSDTVIWTEPDLAWSIVGRGDFDGDDVRDYVWWNSTTGQVWIMFMASPSTFRSGAVVWTEPDIHWRIVATGDLNGDAKTDLIWWNDQTGQVFAALMNGTSITSSALIWTEPDTNYKIVAAGDSNGDGKADILWWNSTTGQVFTALMNGLTPGSSAVIGTEPDVANWRIVDLGDIDGDGKADLVWRNRSNGWVYAWLLDGIAITGSGLIWNEPDLNWEIVNLDNYTIDTDNKADLLWRNKITGQVFLSPMNGLNPIPGNSAVIWTEPSATWRIQGATEWRNNVYGVGVTTPYGSITPRIGYYQDGTWYIDQNGNNVWDGPTVDRQYSFGFAGALPVTGDWNGDGTTKIGVFGDGTWYLDTNHVNMASYVYVSPQNPGDTAWDSVGSADFNNDSKPDVLWRNTTTGENYVWYMDGTTLIGAVSIDSVPDLSWKIVGAADFNSDGKSDILWRHTTTGLNAVWFMDGAIHTGSDYSTSVPDLNWDIVGIGDFNNDSKPDILWRNAATGENAVWYMDGVTMTAFAYLDPVPDLNQQIVGVGDFNGDGQTDILFQHKVSGDLLVWFMNGIVITDYAYLNPNNPGSLDWKGRAIQDFNGDGKPDILFRNAMSGDLVIWHMIGIGANGVFDGGDKTYTFGVPGDLPVTGDWNGDGKTEIGVLRGGGTWFLDMNGNGAWEDGIDAVYSFGAPGDKPITGDWNGDGRTKIGSVRGNIWFLDMNGNGISEAGEAIYYFGDAPDVPITGDWTGSGPAKIGVFRNGAWYLDLNGNGAWDGTATDRSYNFGNSGDTPVTGKW